MASLSLQVRKIESYRDLDGKLGRLIELVEIQPVLDSALRRSGYPDIGEIVKGTIHAVQVVIPEMAMSGKSFSIVKIVLFLTEEESENLGVKFRVNRNYHVTLNKQKIEFMEGESFHE